MIFGIFIDITKLFGGVGSAFGSCASAAGAMAQQQAASRALEAQRLANMPKVVEKPPHLPRVKRKAK